MKILINAISVKKRAGGAFQISTNFIRETHAYKDIDFYYVVSSDIDEILGSNFQNNNGERYFVFPNQPDFKGTYWKVRKRLKEVENMIQPDVVYSLSSPSYFSFRAPEVMRFANAWITNPNEYVAKILKTSKRLYLYFFIRNQKRLMAKRKYFVTQSNAVKNGILNITGTKPENVKVVPNVLPAFFSNMDSSSLVLNKENSEGVINIACVAVPSQHKNLIIIPSVLKELKEKHNITNVKFLMTIPKDNSFLIDFKNKLTEYDVEFGFENYGYCTQKELAELYQVCDLCFMPTLLETFSASILEAMFFNLGIVATDFEFNREVAKDSALYFQPMNATSAAEKIALLIKKPLLKNELKAKMSDKLKNYRDYNNHIKETISFIKDIANKDKEKNTGSTR